LILVDANVFMYAAGGEHRHKQPSLDFLRRVARGEIEVLLDAEVLQEILHRYRAIGRWAEGRQVYDLARRIVPTVAPITADVVDRAREILETHEEATARDALHAAACQLTGAQAICSYDRDFDAIEGVRRVEPDQLSQDEETD